MSISGRKIGLIPNEIEVTAARESRRLFAAFDSGGKARVSMRLLDGAVVSPGINLPPFALGYLEEILRELSKGNGVRIDRIHALLTVREAAELLNVPNSHLKRLIDDGTLASQGQGRSLRVSLTELVAYSVKVRALSRTAIG